MRLAASVLAVHKGYPEMSNSIKVLARGARVKSAASVLLIVAWAALASGCGGGGGASADTGGNPGPDTSAPSVSVTGPTGGAALAGVVALAATASDNVGVAGVQFRIDGANVGAEDTSAPFAFTWNSATVANGPHAITAVARDAAGNTTVSAMLDVVISNAAIQASAMPGIPLPDFCINDVAPAAPAGWPGTEAPGFYYVDVSHPQATDTSNVYGTSGRPRRTVPTTLAAGAVVEMHGGPYTSGSGRIASVASGTAQQPVFIRGANAAARPTIRTQMVMGGAYVILENLAFETLGTAVGSVGFRIVGSVTGVHHACVRDSVFNGPGTDQGNGSVISMTGAPGNLLTDIVVLRNTIQGYGLIGTTLENDYHAIHPSAYVSRIWVLENHAFNLGGDSIQVGGATLNATPGNEQRPSYIYIGGNHFHDNRENSVDVKRADHVVISGNTMHGAKGANSDPGAVVVVHNDPTYVWVLANEIYDANTGVSSTGADGFYVIGNVVHGIHRAQANASGGAADADTAISAHRSGFAIRHYSTANVVVANNTVADSLLGIGADVNSGGSPVWVNNIVADMNLADSGAHYVMTGSVANLATSTWRNNLAHQSGGAVANSPTAFGQASGNLLNIDPLFVNKATRDYRLSAGSPAFDAGLVPDAMAVFQNLYGFAVNVDRDGRSRAQGSAWDLGAYER
jgi:Bacterial Ig domain